MQEETGSRHGGVGVDEIDAAILRLLKRDSRLPMIQLAAQANISRSTAYHRIARLVETGLIKRFGIDVDPVKLGLPVAALILMKVDQADWRIVREKLLTLPGVERLFFTTGSFDLAMLVRVASIEDLRDVVLERIHGIPAVTTTQTAFVLDEYAADV